MKSVDELELEAKIFINTTKFNLANFDFKIFITVVLVILIGKLAPS